MAQAEGVAKLMHHLLAPPLLQEGRLLGQAGLDALLLRLELPALARLGELGTALRALAHEGLDEEDEEQDEESSEDEEG